MTKGWAFHCANGVPTYPQLFTTFESGNGFELCDSYCRSRWIQKIFESAYDHHLCQYELGTFINRAVLTVTSFDKRIEFSYTSVFVE